MWHTESNHSIDHTCAGNPMRYSKGVLLGCWFDERTALEEDTIKQRKEKLCAQYKSIYRTHYQLQDGKLHDETVQNYFGAKRQAYFNFMEANLSNIKLIDHQQYLNNMTTTTDFSYRIYPQYVRSVGEDVLHIKKLDISKAFGNVTTTGVTNYLNKQAKDEAFQGVHYSIYQTSYNICEQKC